jgi:S-adenosylmethionine-dependent methyltransferase
VPEADAFAGRAEWFDDHYASVRGRIRLELVLERLKPALPPAPARILDAGGGTGAFAIPLAAAGYDVTLLDQSAEWLLRARSNASRSGVHLDFIQLGLESLTEGIFEPFDAVLCHAVLMYLDDPLVGLRALRSVARQGTVLSLLEKNRDALAMRPGLQGDYREAHRLLVERDSVGPLGVRNRAHDVDELCAMLAATGWLVEGWSGVRLFSDVAPEHLEANSFDLLMDLERAAGTMDPYRRIARLIHVIARATE